MTTEDNTIQLDFAVYLKDLLEDRDMAPKGLARLIGVDASLVRSWLRGSKVPGLSSVYYQLICESLALPAADRKALREAQRHSLTVRALQKLGLRKGQADKASRYIWRSYGRVRRVLPATLRARLARRFEGEKALTPGQLMRELELWNDSDRLVVADCTARADSGRVLSIQRVFVPPHGSALLREKDVEDSSQEKTGSINITWNIIWSGPGRNVVNRYRVSPAREKVLISTIRGYGHSPDDARAFSGTSLDVPVLVNGYQGFKSVVAVINCSHTTRTKARLDVFSTGGGEEEAKLCGAVPIGPIMPEGMAEVWLSELAWLDQGFLGCGKLVVEEEGAVADSPHKLGLYVHISGRGITEFVIDGATPREELNALLEYMTAQPSVE